MRILAPSLLYAREIFFLKNHKKLRPSVLHFKKISYICSVVG